MSNLIFSERFNGTLTDWSLDQTGGTVSIVTQDYSTKMKLNDTSGSGLVSAIRNFTAPIDKYIIEFDMKVATSAICKVSIRDSGNNNIIDLDMGSTANTFSFDTDSTTPSTITWNNGVYKQVILVIDPTALTVKCYISEDDGAYGSLQQVGATKSYSNVIFTNIIFYTTNTSTGITYIDEVRLYTPDLFFIGDSITDGKPYWSTHPEYPAGRLAAQEDETSSPSYKLSQLFGSNVWVTNRAFGGTNLSGVDSKIQQVILDHNAKRVFMAVGHNDIYPGTGNLTTMKTTMNSIISKVISAGIIENNIILGNVMPSAFIDTTPERTLRDDWNKWLRTKAYSIRAIYVDSYTAMKDGANPNILNSSYKDTDGVHLIPAGSQAFADCIYSAIINEPIFTQQWRSENILRGNYGINDERLFPKLNTGSSTRLWNERQRRKDRTMGRIR